jgi:hypothetical protein
MWQGILGCGRDKRFDLGNKWREAALRDVPDDIELRGAVSVNQFVAHVDDVAPRNVRVSVLEIG